MRINQKQIESILALPSVKRYEHFIKVVADRQEAWGLYRDGWALAGADDGATVFPIWPTQEYAFLCANAEWSGYVPEPFSVDDLLSDLLPKLKRDGVLPGIFYTPADKGITPPVDLLESDLRAELERY